MGYIVLAAFFLVFVLNALLGRTCWHVFEDIVHFAWMCRLLRAINMLGTFPLFSDWRGVWSPRSHRDQLLLPFRSPHFGARGFKFFEHCICHRTSENLLFGGKCADCKVPVVVNGAVQIAFTWTSGEKFLVRVDLRIPQPSGNSGRGFCDMVDLVRMECLRPLSTSRVWSWRFHLFVRGIGIWFCGTATWTQRSSGRRSWGELFTFIQSIIRATLSRPLRQLPLRCSHVTFFARVSSLCLWYGQRGYGKIVQKEVRLRYRVELHFLLPRLQSDATPRRPRTSVINLWASWRQICGVLAGARGAVVSWVLPQQQKLKSTPPFELTHPSVSLSLSLSLSLTRSLTSK